MATSYSRARDVSHKHVTTACDPCRQKRCKCNGQLPCSPCSSTGRSCVYDHNDRRSLRKERNVLSKPTGQPAIQDGVDSVRDHGPVCPASRRHSTDVNDTKQEMENERSNGLIPRRGCGSPDVRVSCTSNTEMSYRPKTGTSAGQQTKSIPSFGTRRDGVAGVRAIKGRTLKDMKGKFRLEARPQSCDANTGISRLPQHRLLPKAVSETDRQTNSGYQHNQREEEPSRQLMWQLERPKYAAPGYTRTFGNLPFSSAISANGYSPSVQAHQALNFSTPPHLVPPLVNADDSPLGRVLTDFQQLGQRLIAGGTPAVQIADSEWTDVSLFFRDRQPEDPVTASTWTAEMLRAFRGTFPDELLLACAVCVHKLMCWLLVPTPENYVRIPSLMRPTALQKLRPHPPWVDLMMFPAFRDALTRRSRDWVEPCMRAQWRLLWPHPMETALVHSAHTNQIFITPEFAVYVDSHQSWLMQPSILEDFPEIRASEINIAPE